MFHDVQGGDPHTKAVCTAMQPSSCRTWRQHVTCARGKKRLQVNLLSEEWPPESTNLGLQDTRQQGALREFKPATKT